MRSSLVAGLLSLALVDKFSHGLPQLLSQQLTPQQLTPPQQTSQPVSSTQLPLSTSSTQARAILLSPNGAPIFGIVDFRSSGSNGIQVDVVVHGLDQSVPHVGHPFHIHTHGVGSDGNCEAAGGHLSPTGIPDSVPCNPQTPHLCQEGNLSGKWGLLSGTQRDVSVTFTDHQLQFSPGASGIIGRAVVLHDSKGGRIACGNINLR